MFDVVEDEVFWVSRLRTAFSELPARQLGLQPWPTYNPEFLVENTKEIVIQVNGKLRDKVVLPELPPPLAPKGTPFQQAVWQQLLCIPYGHTTTYGAIAAALRARGMRASAQAVGGAVGRNPLSLFIPCHRVLGADGSLTGYAAGVEKKLRLLHLECRGYHRAPVPE